MRERQRDRKRDRQTDLGRVEEQRALESFPHQSQKGQKLVPQDKGLGCPGYNRTGRGVGGMTMAGRDTHRGGQRNRTPQAQTTLWADKGENHERRSILNRRLTRKQLRLNSLVSGMASSRCQVSKTKINSIV